MLMPLIQEHTLITTALTQTGRKTQRLCYFLLCLFLLLYIVEISPISIAWYWVTLALLFLEHFLYFIADHGTLWEANCNLSFAPCLTLHLSSSQFKSRKEDRERKGSIPFHHTGKRRPRRMGVPFLLHEDHLDVSPTRSTFSFGSFSGLGEDRRGIEKGGWQTTILGDHRDLPK